MRFKEHYFGEDKKEYKLFVDLDGTLTDWDGDFEKIAGCPGSQYEDEHGTEAMWKLIEDQGEEFWSEMSWLPYGKKLWEFCKKCDPKATILSTPSLDEASKTGKEKWIKRL